MFGPSFIMSCKRYWNMEFLNCLHYTQSQIEESCLLHIRLGYTNISTTIFDLECVIRRIAKNCSLQNILVASNWLMQDVSFSLIAKPAFSALPIQFASHNSCLVTEHMPLQKTKIKNMQKNPNKEGVHAQFIYAMLQ